MKINEIFYSIQGEGPRAGRPTIFVRFSGCNLRCSWCDTKYAWEHSEELTIEEVIERIKKYPCNEVCFTGGEPALYQEDINKLISFLNRTASYHFSIETNGELPLTEINEIISEVAISPKRMESVKGVVKTLENTEHIYNPFLKVVYSGRNEAFSEDMIKAYIKALEKEGICLPVYVMGLTTSKVPLETFKDEMKAVRLCLKNGWIFSPRLQVLYGVK